MDEGIVPGIDEEQDAADALAFVLSGDRAQGRRDHKPPVLEVFHLWGNAVLDARRFPDATRRVVLGSRSGRRWRFLGVDMGFVPDAVAPLLPAVAPLWSDVTEVWKSDFVVPQSDLPDEEDWALFAPGDTGTVARVAKGWGGYALLAGQRKSFDDLVAAGRAVAADGGYDVPMAADLRLVIEAGGARFIAQLGPSTALVQRDDEVEPGFLALIGFGGFLFAMVAVLARLGQPTESVSAPSLDSRLVELLLEQPRPASKVKVEEAASSRGERAKGPEGKVGREDATRKQARGDKREMDRLEMDRRVAEGAGVLGAFEDEGFDQRTGPAGLSELADGIGDIIGDRGVQFGSNGLGERGDDFGAGGEAEGLGGLDTLPGGDGRDDWGADGADLGRKSDGVITSEDAPVIIGPPMDPALIDEVVKRHLPQIRYCYQRELPRDPTLQGRVVIRFTIAKDGSVSSAASKSSTLGNSAVESCIAGRFLTMQFPEPRGGGLVIVSYPFTLRSGH